MALSVLNYVSILFASVLFSFILFKFYQAARKTESGLNRQAVRA